MCATVCRMKRTLNHRTWQGKSIELVEEDGLRSWEFSCDACPTVAAGLTEGMAIMVVESHTCTADQELTSA